MNDVNQNQESNAVNQTDTAVNNKENAGEELVSKAELDKVLAELRDVRNAKKYAFDEWHKLKNTLSAQEQDKQKADQEKMVSEGKYKELAESFKKKHDDLVMQIEAKEKAWQTEKLDAMAKQAAIDAGAMGVNVKFLSREIRDRLAYNDGQLCVLDNEGRVSASNLAELVNEIKNDEQYHGLIAGRKSSGGGAGSIVSGSAGNHKSFKEMTESERVALYRKSPVEYERAKQNAQ